jgi:Na+-driven multidrug efflux pump
LLSFFFVVVVGVVVGLLLAGFEEELPELLLPHPVAAKVLARATTSVRIAVSEILFMGRAPVVAR